LVRASRWTKSPGRVLASSGQAHLAVCFDISPGRDMDPTRGEIMFNKANSVDQAERARDITPVIQERVQPLHGCACCPSKVPRKVTVVALTLSECLRIHVVVSSLRRTAWSWSSTTTSKPRFSKYLTTAEERKSWSPWFRLAIWDSAPSHKESSIFNIKEPNS